MEAEARPTTTEIALPAVVSDLQRHLGHSSLVTADEARRAWSSDAGTPGSATVAIAMLVLNGLITASQSEALRESFASSQRERLVEMLKAARRRELVSDEEVATAPAAFDADVLKVSPPAFLVGSGLLTAVQADSINRAMAHEGVEARAPDRRVTSSAQKSVRPVDTVAQQGRGSPASGMGAYIVAQRSAEPRAATGAPDVVAPRSADGQRHRFAVRAAMVLALVALVGFGGAWVARAARQSSDATRAKAEILASCSGRSECVAAVENNFDQCIEAYERYRAAVLPGLGTQQEVLEHFALGPDAEAIDRAGQSQIALSELVRAGDGGDVQPETDSRVAPWRPVVLCLNDLASSQAVPLYGLAGPTATGALAPSQAVVVDDTSPVVIPGARFDGVAIVSGGLRPDQIRAVVEHNILQLRYCYEDGLTRNPSMHGRVNVDIRVSRSGSVASATVWYNELGAVSYNAPGDDAVANCIVSAVEEWMFPRPDPAGVVTAQFPILFVTDGRIGRGLGGRNPIVPRARPDGAATVLGGLSPDQIRAVVERNIASVQRCYESGLNRNFWMDGRVDIDFRIDESGSVLTTAVAAPGFVDATVGNCIATAAQGWAFPRPDPLGVVTVRLPLVLELYERE